MLLICMPGPMRDYIPGIAMLGATVIAALTRWLFKNSGRLGEGTNAGNLNWQSSPFLENGQSKFRPSFSLCRPSFVSVFSDASCWKTLSRHASNLKRWQAGASTSSNIVAALKAYDTKFNPRGQNVPEASRVYRVQVLHTLVLISGESLMRQPHSMILSSIDAG
jgi:hypothetical protein